MSPLMRYRVWPGIRHTTRMPSHRTKLYALYMKISTYPSVFFTSQYLRCATPLVTTAYN